MHELKTVVQYRKIARSPGLGFSCLIALLLSLAFVAFRSYAHFVNANRRDIQSYKAMVHAKAMEASLDDIGAGVHEYALTNDERYHARMLRDELGFLHDLAQAQTLTADNDTQQLRLRSLKLQERRWAQKYVTSVLGAKDKTNKSVPPPRYLKQILRQSEGPLDQMRAMLDEFEGTETQLLQNRGAQVAYLQTRTAEFLLFGALLAVSISIALSIFLSRNIGRLQQAHLDFVEEVAERKLAERANQRIMDYSQDVICTVDEFERYLQVSAASNKVWGYEPSELIGNSFLRLVCPEDMVRTKEAIREIMSGHPTPHFENSYIRKDGTMVALLWSAVWVEAEKIMFCVAHDHSRQKEAELEIHKAREEAERANMAKSEFLSRMSHELRTPLNAILGFGQLLEMDELSGTQLDNTRQILRGGRHLLSLINEVLDIARIETGQLSYSLEPVPVTEVVQEAQDLIDPLANAAEIAFRNLLLPTGDQCHVRADRQRLKQVLLNLFANAVKYNYSGGTVTVRGERLDTLFRISITDTGVGISPEDVAKLFVPFERLTARNEIEGTGLGLALSKRLMEAMGGAIGVESVRGQGSVFWIELPIAENPMLQAELTGVQSIGVLSDCAQEHELARNVTILYVEDNLSNLKLVERLLSRHPEITVITAMQGSVGLDLARDHFPDLILLDLHLPDMDGDEVLQRLQGEDATTDIPVVMLSADATRHQMQRLMNLGARDYLTKPVDVKQFVRVLNEQLEIKLRV